MPSGRWRRWKIPWGRWWYRLDPRRFVRPNQKDRTGGVVDDETRGVAQAVRAETRTVTVAGHHQKVGALGDCSHNFALEPSPTMEELRVISSEPPRCGGQDLRGSPVREVLEAGGGPVPLEGAPEKAGGCSLGDIADIGRRDVEERDLRSWGDDFCGSVDAALPCPLNQPDNDPHGCIIPPISTTPIGPGWRRAA